MDMIQLWFIQINTVVSNMVIYNCYIPKQCFQHKLYLTLREYPIEFVIAIALVTYNIYYNIYIKHIRGVSNMCADSSSRGL